MSAKVILVFCAQVLFIQQALSLCVGRPNLGAGLGSYGLSTPIASGFGSSGCAGPVRPAPVLPTPSCSGLGYNGGNGLIPNGCAGNWANNGVIGDGIIGNGLIGNGWAGLEIIPTSGGSLPVSSSSSMSPTGLSVVSENVLEGTLYVVGELPFLSTVALEGAVPSGGAGAVSHSCGNGVTAIESISPAAAASAGAYGAGLGAYGTAAGIAPLSLLPGAGCNAPVAEIVAPNDGCYPPGIFY